MMPDSVPHRRFQFSLKALCIVIGFLACSLGFLRVGLRNNVGDALVAGIFLGCIALGLTISYLRIGDRGGMIGFLLGIAIFCALMLLLFILVPIIGAPN